MNSDVDLWELLNRLKEWQPTAPLVIVGKFRDDEDGVPESFSRGDLSLSANDMDELESGIRTWLRSPRSMNASYLLGWEQAAEYVRLGEMAGEVVLVEDVVWWVVDDCDRKSMTDQWCGDLEAVEYGVRDWFLAYKGEWK